MQSRFGINEHVSRNCIFSLLTTKCITIVAKASSLLIILFTNTSIVDFDVRLHKRTELFVLVLTSVLQHLIKTMMMFKNDESGDEVTNKKGAKKPTPKKKKPKKGEKGKEEEIEPKEEKLKVVLYDLFSVLFLRRTVPVEAIYTTSLKYCYTFRTFLKLFSFFQNPVDKAALKKFALAFHQKFNRISETKLLMGAVGLSKYLDGWMKTIFEFDRRTGRPNLIMEQKVSSPNFGYV